MTGPLFYAPPLNAHRGKRFAAASALRFFQPSVNGLVALIIAAGALMSVYGILKVNARHDALAYRRALCAARLELVIARNPLIAKGQPQIEDPCRYLAALTGEVVP